MNDKTKTIVKLIFFPVLILYYEILLKVIIYRTVFNTGFVYMFLFSIPIGLIFYLLTSKFNERANKIAFFIILSFLTLYYGVQFIYFKIFYTFTTFYSLIGAGKALSFTNIIFEAIFDNLFMLGMLFTPLILTIALRAKIDFKKDCEIPSKKVVISAFLIQVFTVFTVLSSDGGMLSPSYLYRDTFLVVDSVDKFGLLTTGRLDIKNILKDVFFAAEPEPADFIESETNIIENEAPKSVEFETSHNDLVETEEQDQGYNIMDIPFGELIENEKNEEIKRMHEYLSNIQPTKKNKYTGMYKGKNLIMITAEGFSPYAVNKDLTPTLYKMLEEGFKFNNFYTPLWGVSTSDGEYVACTGLLPKEGIWSFYKSSQNYLPFAMGNQLKKSGYETMAYHNHYFDYYFRDKSHPNLGYKYKGLGNGLDVTETWPESDLEMIELTTSEYMDFKPFHTYYMTVSGHLQYNFTGNYIAAKNKELVKDLPYSDSVKAYLACNIEFDKAMEKLIQELEKNNIAEDTLIAISPDHYPYGLTLPELSELAGKEITGYDLYKGIFILWNKGMVGEEVNKVCSSLDILPTLSNLMGLEFDSRLLAGNDILSDSPSLVVFSDRSWLTDEIFYDAKIGKAKSLKEENIDKEYIELINNSVKLKFKYSAMILDTNYYKILQK